MVNENAKTYKEIMDNQHDLRVKLTSIMQINGLTIRELSIEMGLNRVTLGRFLTKGIDIKMINPLMKIRSYIEEQNK